MPIGLLTGLGAALAWGTLDVFSALASRRVGSLLVTTGMQVVGGSLIWLVALATGVSLPTDPAVLIGGSLVGLAGAGAYLSYFTGLRIGPISVVSGMVAAYGGLTVVLAVLFRGESLTPLQALGATTATIGVILTGVAFGGGLRGIRFAGPGVVFAIVALILFAVDDDRQRHRARADRLGRGPPRLALGQRGHLGARAGRRDDRAARAGGAVAPGRGRRLAAASTSGSSPRSSSPACSTSSA